MTTALSGYVVGQFVAPTLTVAPFGGTTAATLEVLHDGEALTPELVPTSSDGGETWTAPAYELDAPGLWTEVWTVTGTGAGSVSLTREVEPNPPAAIAPPTSYATSAQFYAHPGSASFGRLEPDALAGLLYRASLDVDQVLIASVYDATDADVIAALASATAEQACWRIASGQESGINAGYHSVQIGSVNLTRGYSSKGSGAEGDKFSLQAFAILQLAGLTGQAPWR